MGFRSLQACVAALRAEGQAVVVDHVVDPHLEIAEIQRRLFRSGGPAVLFTRAKGSAFPVLVNLYGTEARVERIFADTLDRVKRLVELKLDPAAALQRPWRYWRSPIDALAMLPRRVRSGPVLAREILLSRLPQVTGWPGDGGAFVTLPAVYTEHPDRPGTQHSNLGMYRVQLSGNAYEHDREVGLHYQIHRGIGVHHAAALARGEPLEVAIFVGGSPAMAVSAMMPLPEGLSELTFAGALAGHRIPMIRRRDRPAIYADADFVIEGTIQPGAMKPEGPFGDHLGYYARRHEFPVMRVEHVWHREGAIWPVTVVGRPPQEDTLFGWLVHELTGPVIPTVLPGVRSIHAVDASGVHPLLLAVGSERYLPWKPATMNRYLASESCPWPRIAEACVSSSAGRVAGRRPRRGPVPRPPARTGRLPTRLPLPHRDHDRHARLLRLGLQRRLEARGRRTRAGDPVAAKGTPRRHHAPCGLHEPASLPRGNRGHRGAADRAPTAARRPDRRRHLGDGGRCAVGQRRGAALRRPRPGPPALRVPADRGRRRPGLHGHPPRKLPLDHVHAVEPRGRRARRRRLHEPEALGLPRTARDRRAAQA
ncbi:UbiD family decarboxylase, partial [bacterium]|nr:UbiD family decarboxylase [bacterium]